MEMAQEALDRFGRFIDYPFRNRRRATEELVQQKVPHLAIPVVVERLSESWHRALVELADAMAEGPSGGGQVGANWLDGALAMALQARGPEAQQMANEYASSGWLSWRP